MADGSSPQLQKLSDLQNDPGKKRERNKENRTSMKKGKQKQETGSAAKSLVADHSSIIWLQPSWTCVSAFTCHHASVWPSCSWSKFPQCLLCNWWWDQAANQRLRCIWKLNRDCTPMALKCRPKVGKINICQMAVVQNIVQMSPCYSCKIPSWSHVSGFLMVPYFC